MAPLHGDTAHLAGDSGSAWRHYICGHCNTRISGAVVSIYQPNHPNRAELLVCPHCFQSSVYIQRTDRFYPGVSFGFSLQGLPENVRTAYEEARRCMSVNAFTATELICRKILMHVAVDKGASEGQPFASYLDYLEKQGYITSPIRTWVNQIRENGNEATHELIEPSKERAEMTLMFTSQLLRLIYEMEYIQNQYLTGLQNQSPT